MPSTYIYMEHPETAELLTLGKITLHHNKTGEFFYSAAALEANAWVPDPIRYPLTNKVYSVTKNQGIPGFIDDAMPDGWGEKMLQSMQDDPVNPFNLLSKSPNSDRVGNLLTGPDEQPPNAIEWLNLPELTELDAFLNACEMVYDRDVKTNSMKQLKIREQLSSLGGARPKRTFQGEKKMILAKPQDRFDQYDAASLEHACMVFAASKGMRVAKTALHMGQQGPTLLVERFDRQHIDDAFRRIPLLSGLTLLDTEWNIADLKVRSYARLADEMKRREVPNQDLRELYMRMIYNALVGNADDHPRNHAIIYIDGSWRLSPMYDALPLLDEGSAKQLSMSVGIDGAKISRANLLSQYKQFALTQDEAEGILELVASWEEELKEHYSSFVKGQDLELAREATSATRIMK